MCAAADWWLWQTAAPFERLIIDGIWSGSIKTDCLDSVFILGLIAANNRPMGQGNFNRYLPRVAWNESWRWSSSSSSCSFLYADQIDDDSDGNLLKGATRRMKRRTVALHTLNVREWEKETHQWKEQANNKSKRKRRDSVFHYQVIGSSKKDWRQNQVENLDFHVNEAYGLLIEGLSYWLQRFSTIFDEFLR